MSEYNGVKFWNVWIIGTVIVLVSIFSHPPFWIALGLFSCGSMLQTCGFIMAGMESK